MKNTKQTDNSFKSRLMDVITGNIELSPSLHSSCIRNGTISDMSADEKYLLFFSIVNQSSNAVVITDDRKRIIYVNKKFEQISGYSADEILGKNPSIQKSGKTPVETYQEMHRKLKAKEHWKGEFINRHRDGNEYIEEAVISPITNTQGDIICFLSEKKDITAQKEAEKSVQELMHFDSLTRIPNRTYFLKEVDRLTDMARVDENHFSVLFIDLNRFKELNDTYGHIAGDKALQQVAERIQQIIPLGDFVARVGGDEFVVVHKNADEASTAQLASKIADSFNSPIILHDKNSFLGVSIGSAIWPVDGLSIKKILIRADLAMYNSKLSSQRYTPYTDSLGKIYGREFKLARKLNQAISDNNLSLVYQPKVDLQTGQISGMEALLRWDDPELGFVSPAEFIPIAEKYKKMTVIGDWVLKEACRQINRWKSEQKDFKGRIAVNISVQQIENTKFYENMLNILYGENVSPSMIELEVTESLLISDPDRVMSLFDKLKSAGFSIAIDDFGTGYSSLAYLRKFKADTLKIDKSFIDNITDDSQDRSIVKSIIELGHNLNLSVIAEGVENKAQLNHLKLLGCDEAQGYLFSKPQSSLETFPLKNHRNLVGKAIEKRLMGVVGNFWNLPATGPAQA